MLRLLFALALLALAPTAWAQPTPDTTSTAPHQRRVLADGPSTPTDQAVAASTLGALSGGLVTGAAGGVLVLLTFEPSVLGGNAASGVSDTALKGLLALGISVGAAGGAALDRRTSFWRAFGGAALGQVVGFGVGALVDGTTGSELGYIAMPVGAVAGSVWATR